MRKTWARTCMAIMLVACTLSLSPGAAGASTLLPQPWQIQSREQLLNQLFESLASAQNDASASSIADRIQMIWLSTESSTVDFLMRRLKLAIVAKEQDLQLDLLSRVVAIDPKYVAAWNIRAGMYFVKKDYKNALSDVAHVLSLEPRHFGALRGLANILMDIGKEQEALKVLRRVLAIYPRMEGVRETERRLAVRVEGKNI